MCERCARVDELVREVNLGIRPFDAELLTAMLLQNKHVIDEMLDDVASGSKALHELLSECAHTMAGLGVALLTNTRPVEAAAQAERDRLVKIGMASEAGIDHPLAMHLRTEHGRDTTGWPVGQMVGWHTEHHRSVRSHEFDDFGFGGSKPS